MRKIYQEEEKILVVSCPNTIHDPNTMMIHLKNTPLTCGKEGIQNKISKKVTSYMTFHYQQNVEEKEK